MEIEVKLNELEEKGEQNSQSVEESSKMDSRTIFVRNLHQLLGEKGASRKEVSEAIGVSYFTFTSWWNGTKYPRIESIELLADYFSVSVPELVGDMPDTPKEKYTEENNDVVQVAIGQRIKRRRKELSMTADELGERLGKDRATIYRYESGSIENMPIGLLTPLAEALDVSVEYLIGNEALQKTASTSSRSPDVLDVVVRLHSDPQFLKVVEKMSKLDDSKLKALQLFLKAFGE